MDASARTVPGGKTVIVVAVLEILFVAMLIIAMALAVWKDIHKH
jgi:hypothetical protein